MNPDGLGQLLERSLVKVLSGLIGIGHDLGDGQLRGLPVADENRLFHLNDPGCRRGGLIRFLFALVFPEQGVLHVLGLGVRKQGGQALSQAFHLHRHSSFPLFLKVANIYDNRQFTTDNSDCKRYCVASVYSLCALLPARADGLFQNRARAAAARAAGRVEFKAVDSPDSLPG